MHCHSSFLSLSVLTLLFATATTLAGPPTNGATQKSTNTGSPAGDAVAAMVNGERIMLSELIARLDELGVEPDKREEVAGHVLDGLVDNALLVQFLVAQKMPYDNKEIDKQFAELRAEAEKEGVKFAVALARLGMNEQKLREALIAEARWQNYLKKRVTDKDLTNYFVKHREGFDGTQVRASHILVEVPADADAATRAAAKAKIERIRKELATGLDFAEAAGKYSDCPSKQQGGDVDWFQRRDKMVEPFAKAAFALKVGETSGTVETEFGYHLIKVTGRKPGTRTKLDDPGLRHDLLESLGDEMKEEIVAKQRKVAKIQIAPDVIAPEQRKTKTAAQPTNKAKK